MRWFKRLLAYRRIEIHNAAYQKGFEDGIRSSSRIALQTANQVKSQWESQFTFTMTNSDDVPKVRNMDLHIPTHRDSSGMKVFHAKAVVGYFIVNPIADSYAYFDKDYIQHPPHFLNCYKMLNIVFSILTFRRSV